MAYSDTFKQEALICLALNKYNYAKAADSVGVPIRTLRRWDKDVAKNSVPELLERAIEHLLASIPTLRGQDWAIALGILMDKWLLLQGMPTQRTEGIWKRIEQMNDTELDDVLAEAERILAVPVPAGGGGNGDGQGEGGTVG